MSNEKKESAESTAEFESADTPPMLQTSDGNHPLAGAVPVLYKLIKEAIIEAGDPQQMIHLSKTDESIMDQLINKLEKVRTKDGLILVLDNLDDSTGEAIWLTVVIVIMEQFLEQPAARNALSVVLELVGTQVGLQDLTLESIEGTIQEMIGLAWGHPKVYAKRAFSEEYFKPLISAHVEKFIQNSIIT